MSRLCRLKSKSHGEVGQWAYDEITSLRAEVEQERKQKDYLVELISKAAKWPAGCDTYDHAIGHVENVIINARCDARVEKKFRIKAEAESNQWQEGYFKVLAQNKVLLAAIVWALGAVGDFPPQAKGKGKYWWRKELADRAGIYWDGEKYSQALKEVEK